MPNRLAPSQGWTFTVFYQIQPSLAAIVSCVHSSKWIKSVFCWWFFSFLIGSNFHSASLFPNFIRKIQNGAFTFKTRKYFTFILQQWNYELNVFDCRQSVTLHTAASSMLWPNRDRFTWAQRTPSWKNMMVDLRTFSRKSMKGKVKL